MFRIQIYVRVQGLILDSLILFLQELQGKVVVVEVVEVEVERMAGEEYLLALGHIPQDSEEISQAGGHNSSSTGHNSSRTGHISCRTGHNSCKQSSEAVEQGSATLNRAQQL